MINQPIPHTEARDIIAHKPAVTRAVFDDMVPEIQARAFTITGIESANTLQRARDIIAELPAGADWDDVKRQLFEEISPWLVDPAADGEDLIKQTMAADRRAELLIRMHGWQGYAATQSRLLNAHQDAFPYHQYIDSDDRRVRDTHAALDGITLPADSPFWHNHTPPWEFGCRCDKVGITRAEAEEMIAKEKDKPADSKTVLAPGDPKLTELEQSGHLIQPQGRGKLDVRTTKEKTGKGFEWRPGDLALPLADIKARYEPSVWNHFQEKMKAATVTGLDEYATVWDWLTESPTKPLRSSIHPTQKLRDKITAAVFTSETALGGGVNTTVRLKNGVTVVWKPASGEYGAVLRNGIPAGEQYKREKAVSLIDQYLGTDLVPATEIIHYNGEIGSAQLFRGGYRTAMELGSQGIRPNIDPDILRRWSLLDDVTGHVDRHAGNWMARKYKGTYRLALIDNGLAFSAHPDGSGTRYPVPWAGKRLDADSLRQLDALIASRDKWEPELISLIGQDAVDLMHDRIARLKAKGFGNVAKNIAP